MLLYGIRVTGVLSLLVVVGTFVLFSKCKGFTERRDKIICHVLALILAFFTLLHGTQLMHEIDVSGIARFLFAVIVFAGSEILIETILEEVFGKGLAIASTDDKEEGKFSFAKCYLILVLCQIPFYLCFFPGCVNSDSTDQLLQAMNMRYSNHHPVVQTWMIQAVYRLVSVFTDNLNMTLAVFIAIQELAIMAIYAYTLYTLYEMRVHRYIRVAFMIYLAVFPNNVMMADNMWKDTFFSACFLLFIVSLWRLIRTDGDIRDLFFVFCSGLMVCMFRNNGWYAFLVSLPFELCFFWKKNTKACVTLLCVVISAIIIRGPIFKAFDVASPSMAESLSIPIQQISNVITKGGTLNDEERELLSQVIDIDKIPENYDPHVSDPIKYLLNDKGNLQFLMENKGEFAKMYLNLGLRYPGFYIQGFVNQTEGYYTPDIQRWQYVQGVWDTSMPLSTSPLLPGWMIKIVKAYVSDWLYYIPILGMIKSIGIMVWILLASFAFCIIKKEYNKLSLIIPLVACWATLVVATPLSDEFRYIYWLFLCLPVVLIAVTDKPVNSVKKHE